MDFWWKNCGKSDWGRYARRKGNHVERDSGERESDMCGGTGGAATSCRWRWHEWRASTEGGRRQDVYCRVPRKVLRYQGAVSTSSWRKEDVGSLQGHEPGQNSRWNATLESCLSHVWAVYARQPEAVWRYWSEYVSFVLRVFFFSIDYRRNYFIAEIDQVGQTNAVASEFTRRSLLGVGESSGVATHSALWIQHSWVPVNNALVRYTNCLDSTLSILLLCWMRQTHQ